MYFSFFFLLWCSNKYSPKMMRTCLWILFYFYFKLGIPIGVAELYFSCFFIYRLWLVKKETYSFAVNLTNVTCCYLLHGCLVCHLLCSVYWIFHSLIFLRRAFGVELKYIIIFPSMLFLTTQYRVEGLANTAFSLHSLELLCYSLSLLQ